jgi:hypothetical protein
MDGVALFVVCYDISIIYFQKRNYLCNTNSWLELVKLIFCRKILRVGKSALIHSAWGCKVILNIQFFYVVVVIQSNETCDII